MDMNRAFHIVLESNWEPVGVGCRGGVCEGGADPNEQSDIKLIGQ